MQHGTDLHALAQLGRNNARFFKRGFSINVRLSNPEIDRALITINLSFVTFDLPVNKAVDPSIHLLLIQT